jgi:hypothetical protein
MYLNSSKVEVGTCEFSTYSCIWTAVKVLLTLDEDDNLGFTGCKGEKVVYLFCSSAVCDFADLAFRIGCCER